MRQVVEAEKKGDRVVARVSCAWTVDVELDSVELTGSCPPGLVRLGVNAHRVFQPLSKDTIQISTNMERRKRHWRQLLSYYESTPSQFPIPEFF